jgi:hypothetical protein
MRALIYFPIIHGPEDLGSLNKAASDLRTDQQAHNYFDAIEHFWAMMASTIENLGLDYANLKLYQDGLPVCGKEKEIVADVAKSGSQNYRLLQELLGKGAVLMGTESPELLVQEHALMTQLLQSGQRTVASLEAAEALLKQRDDYIAQRIDKTLQDYEMAMIFLGLMHNIEAKLPKDIVLIQPLGRPAGLKQEVFLAQGD